MLSATLCSDILAIRCINNHVCIGVGNSLHVYEIKNREIAAKLDVFENDNIHSIVKGPAGKLFVYGRKSLGICELVIAVDKIELHLCSVRHFNDWIIAIDWVQYGENTELSILFAHNNLRFYDTNSEKSRTFWCQEKCILYGGSLLAKNNRETVIFSGTVFQEILIWQANSELEYSEDIAVLHRLKGHKGVIFSVIYDSTLKLISSTSDDRTIRLWRVKNKLEDNTSEILWENCEISLTTTMYGHTARVWRSIVRNEKILSIGEDSLICVWSNDGKLLDKIEAHHGAEIWSIDVSDDNEIIFTGGADGAVNIWPFESKDSLQGSLIFASDEEKIPKFVCYKNDSSIFILMDGGHLISYEPDEKSVRTSLNLPRYSSYCVMQISPDRRKIGLASKDGYIETYEEIFDAGNWALRKTLEKKSMESKIFSFHWLTNEMILICGEAGILKLISTLSKNGQVESRFVLPGSRERWTTTAIIHDNLLICGDRAGSIYVFDLGNGNGETGPSQVFPKIHGRLGVQSFSILANKILSTGRDGTVRFYEIDEKTEKNGKIDKKSEIEEKTKILRALHLEKMPMDWVCRVLRKNDDFYILGFKEVEFMIYSMNLKRLVRRFVCGGGHRSWDCEMIDGKINFVYIRDKRIYKLESPLCNTNLPILRGFHTKEIYSLHPIATSSRHDILVSAGEDCSLRVSCVVSKNSKIQKYHIKTLGIYDGHISNVKSLAVLNLQNSEKFTKNLVISGGGRAQLKIWEFKVKCDESILENDDVTCRELFSWMLRGTDKDRKKNWQSVKPGFFVDPETRFMDINAEIYSRDENFIVIFVACSDGFLRILIYDIAKNYLNLSNIVNYCDRCTLRVNSFVHENETILMTMTTDGNVSFWRMSENIENLVKNSRDNIEDESTKVNLAFAKLKIHQSGINSFDFRKFDDSRWLLLTGGDDNLLSLVVIEISTKDQFSVNKIASWDSAFIHSAQITGAKFVGNNRMLSTGIDQRVVAHSYAYSNGLLSVSRIEEATTFVPDVQGLALCRPISGNDETLACVYGKGLEVIILKSEK